jgi:MFS family permease
MTVHASSPEAGALPRSRQGLALTAVLIAPFMAMLDVFIVNIAAPSMQQQLHATFAEIQFVIGGYIVAFAMGLVTAGRLGDMLGRRRIFMVGIICFAITSAGCAVAPNAGVLIGMRLVQGLSAALMVPQVLALIQANFPRDQHSRLLGFYGAAQALGSLSGQLLGGLLVRVDIAGTGWRAIFLVNIPLCLATFLCAAGGLRKQETRAEGVRLDPLGVLLLSLAVGLLLTPLVIGAQDGWSPGVWVALAASLVVFAIFARWESRLSDAGHAALLPMRLFKLRGFAGGLPTSVTFYFGNSGLYLVLAFYLQEGIGLSPVGAAVVFLALAGPAGAASLSARTLVDRFGQQFVRWGAAVMVAGFLLVYLVIRTDIGGDGEISRALWLVPGLVVCGLGLGLVLPSLLGLVLQRIDTADAGAAAGAVLTASQVAAAGGVAGVGAVFRSTLAGGGHSYVHAFELSVLTLSAVGVLSFLLLTYLTRKSAG